MTQREKQERLNALATEKMNLESLLKSGDYKVIKCAEAQAAGEELPYDISRLHAERQQMRDRVNAIENDIRDIEAAICEDEQPGAHPFDN